MDRQRRFLTAVILSNRPTSTLKHNLVDLATMEDSPWHLLHDHIHMHILIPRSRYRRSRHT